jgi:glutamate-1-semialdehyde 2,1-aminomutase
MAMAAGIAQLKILERGGIYERLEATGALLENMIRECLDWAGLNYPFVRLGSMFCLFLQPEGRKVRNLEDAKTCDREAYAKIFHHLLEGGVYFPPSQFETCFLSTAHGAGELELTRTVLRKALDRKA